MSKRKPISESDYILLKDLAKYRAARMILFSVVDQKSIPAMRSVARRIDELEAKLAKRNGDNSGKGEA